MACEDKEFFQTYHSSVDLGSVSSTGCFRVSWRCSSGPLPTATSVHCVKRVDSAAVPLAAVDFCGSRRTSTYYPRRCDSARSAAVAVVAAVNVDEPAVGAAGSVTYC